jgi:hypothetical protein
VTALGLDGEKVFSPGSGFQVEVLSKKPAIWWKIYGQRLQSDRTLFEKVSLVQKELEPH